VSAVQVDAVVTGHEDGPVVVLCNSLGSTYKMWDAQLAALEERFRVVRYDIRGARNAGLSPIHFDPYDLCESKADHPHVRTIAEVEKFSQ